MTSNARCRCGYLSGATRKTRVHRRTYRSQPAQNRPGTKRYIRPDPIPNPAESICNRSFEIANFLFIASWHAPNRVWLWPVPPQQRSASPPRPGSTPPPFTTLPPKSSLTIPFYKANNLAYLFYSARYCRRVVSGGARIRTRSHRAGQSDTEDPPGPPLQAPIQRVPTGLVVIAQDHCRRTKSVGEFPVTLFHAL